MNKVLHTLLNDVVVIQRIDIQQLRFLANGFRMVEYVPVRRFFDGLNVDPDTPTISLAKLIFF